MYILQQLVQGAQNKQTNTQTNTQTNKQTKQNFEILVDPRILIMDQKSQNVIFINNSRKAGLAYLSFDAIFEALGKFSIRCILCFKRMLILLRKSTKHAIFEVEVQQSLNVNVSMPIYCVSQKKRAQTNGVPSNKFCFNT